MTNSQIEYYYNNNNNDLEKSENNEMYTNNSFSVENVRIFSKSLVGIPLGFINGV